MIFGLIISCGADCMHKNSVLHHFYNQGKVIPYLILHKKYSQKDVQKVDAKGTSELSPIGKSN